MRQLSKSKIIAYRQCPRRLWLELHRPELKDDTGNQAVYAIGNQVGEVARAIYDTAGTGELIDIEVMGWDAAYERTAVRLAGEQAPLFEAALRIPGALALADVMLSDGGGSWRMIEVKATASVKDYQRDDIAIQAYVAKQAGVPLASVSLAHVDTSFVYAGEGDYRGLLFEVDLTGEAFAREHEVASWIAGAQEIAAMPEEPEVEPGPQCYDPFECGFCSHCRSGELTSDYPLSSFYRMHAPKRDMLEAAGYTDIREVPDGHLSATNLRIKEQSVKGETYFDAAGAAAEIARHPGEPRFLDFETIAFAVPIWTGTSPYKAIPFQFSLHRREASGAAHHEEFLDTSASDPRRPLAEALVESCGTEGPVFAYNASFEKGVIARLADCFPDLSGPLWAIHVRVVDLEPITRRHFYAPSQHGSWSLKAVLPAICPELDYAQLDGVQNGDHAQQAYLEAIAPTSTPERRAEIRRQLLDYCKLDTLALVRIWERFAGLA